MMEFFILSTSLGNIVGINTECWGIVAWFTSTKIILKILNNATAPLGAIRDQHKCSHLWGCSNCHPLLCTEEHLCTGFVFEENSKLLPLLSRQMLEVLSLQISMHTDDLSFPEHFRSLQCLLTNVIWDNMKVLKVSGQLLYWVAF